MTRSRKEPRFFNKSATLAISRAILSIGDVYAIPLQGGGYAFGQYVAMHPLMGALVRILNVRADSVPPVGDLAEAGNMFPPVFVGLKAALRSGRWKKIGTLPVPEDPKGRTFRQTFGTKPGTYHDWKIWYWDRAVPVGDLPDDARDLELFQVWGAEGVEDRILGAAHRGERMF